MCLSCGVGDTPVSTKNFTYFWTGCDVGRHGLFDQARIRRLQGKDVNSQKRAVCSTFEFNVGHPAFADYLYLHVSIQLLAL